MPATPTLPLKRFEAIAALGGNAALFRRCEKAGWINKVSGLYDIAEIHKAWSRLKSGEKPEAKK